MPELQTPIREQLDSSVPEADVRRLWLGVAERRQRLARRPTWFGSSYFALAAVGLVVAALVVVWRHPTSRSSGATDAVAGPLLMTDGRSPTTLNGEAQAAFPLADGSRIELAKSAKLEVLDNDGRRFISVLRNGVAHFEVRPGGRRRWTVEAGLASVEVVGTGFTVRRGERDVEVSVTHGTVIVRGQNVPDQVQRLTGGQRLLVEAGTPPIPSASSQPSAPLGLAAAESQLPAAHVVEPGVRAEADSSPSERVARWLAEADRARRVGDTDRAVRALRSALAEADGRQAALLSFTLGKLLLDGAGRAGEAEEAFARCLALGPPAALAEDALARLVEAEARAGKFERARATAIQYQRLYPAGRRLSEVRRWANEP